MRQRAKKQQKDHPPLVGVAIDVSSGYGRAVLRGVMRYANLQRRWLIYHFLSRGVDALENWPRCDGAVVAGVGPKAFQHIKERSRHVILCSGGAKETDPPMVALDDEAAGEMAAQHLLDCHLAHFAFYGGSATGVASLRHKGFARALERRGHSCLAAAGDWSGELDFRTHTHWSAVTQWLHGLPKPVGIMAVDDMAAHDLAGACHAAEIEVPDRVAIIGVNNDDLLCEAAWPPLSSVEADFSRMGYVAARNLEHLLEGKELAAEERRVRLPPLGVVQRVSTTVLAVEDPNLAAAIRYIREHACDPCNVDDVIRHVPVGRRWLERQFVAHLARTPHEEIARVRIETAQRLMLRPELSLAEVARRCGFSAVQNLQRTFLALTGENPGAYRNRVGRGQREPQR